MVLLENSCMFNNTQVIQLNKVTLRRSQVQIVQTVHHGDLRKIRFLKKTSYLLSYMTNVSKIPKKWFLLHFARVWILSNGVENATLRQFSWLSVWLHIFRKLGLISCIMVWRNLPHQQWLPQKWKQDTISVIIATVGKKIKHFIENTNLLHAN